MPRRESVSDKMKKYILTSILIGVTCLSGVLTLFVQACADSQAILTAIRLCPELSGDTCEEDQAVFSADSPKIHVTGIVTGVPKTGALVTVAWYYLEEGEPVELNSLTLPTMEEGAGFRFFIEETERWRTGRYEVVLSTGEEGSAVEAGRKAFTIE